MALGSKQTLIFSMAHPFDLIFFLRLVKETDLASSFRIKIIFQKHSYFSDRMDLAKNILSGISQDIFFIENNGIPEYTRELRKNFLLARQLKKSLRSRFDPKDILMILDKSSYCSQLLLSYFRRSILFQFPCETDFKAYEIYWTKTLASNFLNIATGIPWVKILTLRNSPKLIEEYICVLPRTKKFFITDEKDRGPSISFGTKKNTESSKKIVIFGSRYHGWNLDPDTLIDIRSYFKAIFETFKDEYCFIYIKHPLEKGSEFTEIQGLFEGHINAQNEYLNSEHFLIENPDTAYCFSIGSTSSKSAYQLGFDSKVAYRVLLRRTPLVAGFDQIFEDISEDVHVLDWKMDLRKKLAHPIQVAECAPLLSYLEEICAGS